MAHQLSSMAYQDIIDNKILEILDEIQRPRQNSIEYKLHPSYLVNEKSTGSITGHWKLSKQQFDFFKIVNHYHAFCKLCKQHFYTQNVLNDINSYFQNHSNTVDHKSYSIVNPCDADKPIFEWDKWLYTGRCNVCNLTNIEAYIIAIPSLTLLDLITKHIKSYRHESKQEEYCTPVPRHIQLVKKLCSIDVFSKKCIKKAGDFYFCILCAKNLRGKETVIQYHVKSEGHYEKFSRFLKETFSYDSEDLLNGFILEDVLKKALMEDIKVVQNGELETSETEDDYLTDTDYESESELVAYEGIGSQLKGFSPKHIEEMLQVHDEDLVNANNICTLCDENVSDKRIHFSSDYHKLRMITFQRDADIPNITELHESYLKKRTERLKPFEADIKKYDYFKKLLESQNVSFGIPYRKEYDRLKINFTEAIADVPQSSDNIAVDLKSEHIIVVSNGYRCTLCNITCYSMDTLRQHVNSKSHKNITTSSAVQKHDNECQKFVTKLIQDYCSEICSEKCIKVLQNNVVYCELCKLPFNLLAVNIKDHVNGSKHQKGIDQKMELHKLALDPYFVNPMQKVCRSEWVCTVCCCVIHENSICSHIEGRSHYSNYEVCKSRKEELPVFSNFEISWVNLESICKLCSVKINEGRSTGSRNRNIRRLLKKVKEHNHCSGKQNALIKTMNRNEKISINNHEEKLTQDSVNDNQNFNILGKLEDIYKVNQNVVAVNKNIAKGKPMLVPCEKCGVPFKQEDIAAHTTQCSRMVDIDLIMVQNKLQEIFNLFKNEIVQNIHDRLNNVDNNSETSSDRSRSCSESTAPSSRHCSEGSDSPTTLPPPPLNAHKANENAAQPRKRLWRAKDRRDDSEIDTYYCAICHAEGPIEAMEDHIDSRDHYNRETKALRFGNVRMRNCNTCGLQMYGTNGMLRGHFQTKLHFQNQEAEAQRKMDAKMNDMNLVDVLVVTDIPNVENSYDALITLFKKFGTVKHVRFERLKAKATLEFVEPGAIQRALNSQPVLMYNKPLTLTRSKGRGTSKYFLHEDMINLLSNPRQLIEHAVSLERRANEIMDSPAERVREDRVYRTLRKALENVYPASRCYPFGSRFSGLTLQNSDFDIFLDCDNLFSGLRRQEARYQEDIVHNVARALKRNPECTEINSVPRARVPIISFLHKPTNLHCDVSFKNGLSCQNTNLIKFMVSFDPRVKPFILFLKDWIDYNQLHGPPLFSSYAVTMLVIYYLEQLEPPVLPTVEKLQGYYNGPRMTIGGWDCSFCTDLTRIPKCYNKDSLPKLILGFFEFYANFRYSEYVISPLTGKPLPRSAIENMAKEGLPMPYKRQMYNIPIENFARRTYPICIMDPFDLSHNLTKSFPKFGLELFVYFCDASAKLLASALQKPNS